MRRCHSFSKGLFFRFQPIIFRGVDSRQVRWTQLELAVKDAIFCLSLRVLAHARTWEALVGPKPSGLFIGFFDPFGNKENIHHRSPNFRFNPTSLKVIWVFLASSKRVPLLWVPFSFCPQEQRVGDLIRYVDSMGFGGPTVVLYHLPRGPSTYGGGYVVKPHTSAVTKTHANANQHVNGHTNSSKFNISGQME